MQACLLAITSKVQCRHKTHIGYTCKNNLCRKTVCSLSLPFPLPSYTNRLFRAQQITIIHWRKWLEYWKSHLPEREWSKTKVLLAKHAIPWRATCVHRSIQLESTYCKCFCLSTNRIDFRFQSTPTKETHFLLNLTLFRHRLFFGKQFS